MAYLDDHPPARTQFRRRRSQVTGAIVIHTAECATDTIGEDTAAESVARFISTRTDASASYHSVVDSDSTVHVVDLDKCAFHEGTGGNDWSLGLSFAMRAADWYTLPHRWRAGALEQGAGEAARMAAWVKLATGRDVPARRITAAMYRAGQAGFISHAELDPTRRTDPGPGFPWEAFLNLFADNLNPQRLAMTEPTPSPPARTWGLLNLAPCTLAVGELYDAYRGFDDDHDDEEEAWARDLGSKLARGEDPNPTLDYIEYALRLEHEARQNPKP